MSKIIAILALSFGAITAAQALSHPPGSWWQSHEHSSNGGPGSSPAAAPEIDPSSALGGLTLLIGGLAVIRGRRNKR